MKKEREALREYHKEAVKKAKKAREAWEAKTGKKAGGYMKDLYKRKKEENFEIVIEEEEVI